jgi:hypothetical protein
MTTHSELRIARQAHVPQQLYRLLLLRQATSWAMSPDVPHVLIAKSGMLSKSWIGELCQFFLPTSLRIRGTGTFADSALYNKGEILQRPFRVQSTRADGEQQKAGFGPYGNTPRALGLMSWLQQGL